MHLFHLVDRTCFYHKPFCAAIVAPPPGTSDATQRIPLSVVLTCLTPVLKISIEWKSSPALNTCPGMCPGRIRRRQPLAAGSLLLGDSTKTGACVSSSLALCTGLMRALQHHLLTQ